MGRNKNQEQNAGPQVNTDPSDLPEHSHNGPNAEDPIPGANQESDAPPEDKAPPEFSEEELAIKEAQAKDKEKRKAKKPTFDETNLMSLDDPKNEESKKGPKAKIRCWSCGIKYDGHPYDNTDSVSKMEAGIKEAKEWLLKAEQKLSAMKKHPKRNLCSSCRG